MCGRWWWGARFQHFDASGALPIRCDDDRILGLPPHCEPLLCAGPAGSMLVRALLVPGPCRLDGQAAADLNGFDLVTEVSTRVGASLDVGQTARDLMDLTIPRFADFAGIYVLERLLHDEPFPERPGGSVEVRRLALGQAVRYTDPQDWIGAFPPDEVVVYPQESPFARCMSAGEPILLGAADLAAHDLARIQGVLDQAGLEGGMRLVEQSSMLAVPLPARGTLLGFVAFTRRPDRDRFGDDDLAVARGLAGQAAMCIDNARRYSRELHTVRALQSGLAPRQLTVPAGLQIAHRYLPANPATEAGGDWYDVISLSDTRVALVVGDAMGHDAVAAAAMGRLRMVVRALAALDLDPAELLRRLDQVVADTDPDQCATCVYAVGDLAGRSWALASAGHPPPILVHADGTTELVEAPPGLPIGVGDAVFRTTHVSGRDGATLVLYTDGLVESRERDLDTGIAAVCAALTPPHADLEVTCDTITRALPARGDDVTLLLARIPPSP